MSQPPFQPPPQQQPQPATPPPIPQKRKRFGWLALILTAVISLGVGGAVGGSGDSGTPTALPAPTVTETVTEPAVEGGSEPAEAPEPEPTKEPAAWNPKPKDFKVTVKITDKQCFDTAGCLIDYKIALDYLGSQKLPAEGTTDITYQVSGSKDPIIGTITLDSEGKFDASEESTDTSSSSKKLVAKVTEVDYNEFG
jgi:hypothetical protein